MFLNEFETQIELAGADYSARVSFEWDGHLPLINRVEIDRSIHYYYNAAGEYAPHVERFTIDLTAFMDDSQLGYLMDEISEDAAARAATTRAEAELEQSSERQLDSWDYRQAA